MQRTGQTVRLRHLRMCVLSSNGEGPRYGLTVSRRVGNAVVRNRVKRWIRESIRQADTAGIGSVDVVFIARPSAADAGFAAIRRDVEQGLARLGEAA